MPNGRDDGWARQCNADAGHEDCTEQISRQGRIPPVVRKLDNPDAYDFRADSISGDGLADTDPEGWFVKEGVLR